jgi:hypothetical protein
MPMKRGNRVAILDPSGLRGMLSGNRTWVEGRVTSTKTNGWLRIRVRGRGDRFLIRNSPNLVVKLQEHPFPGPAVTTIARFTRGLLARIECRRLVRMGCCINLMSDRIADMLASEASKPWYDEPCAMMSVWQKEDAEFNQKHVMSVETLDAIVEKIVDAPIDKKLMIIKSWVQSCQDKIATGVEPSDIRIQTIEAMFDSLIEGLETIKRTQFV